MTKEEFELQNLTVHRQDMRTHVVSHATVMVRKWDLSAVWMSSYLLWMMLRDALIFSTEWIGNPATSKPKHSIYLSVKIETTFHFQARLKFEHTLKPSFILLK